MKAEVNEKDVVKHWGIWWTLENGETGWVTDDSGIIFSVTCPRVANVQYDILTGYRYNIPKHQLEVKEIV